jgi:hypothetical protein
MFDYVFSTLRDMNIQVGRGLLAISSEQLALISGLFGTPGYGHNPYNIDPPPKSTESQPGQVLGWRPADPKYSTTPASKEPRAGRQLPGSSGSGGTGESPYTSDGAGDAVGEGVGAVVVGGPFAWAVAVGITAVVWPNTIACSTMDCVPPPASPCK